MAYHDLLRTFQDWEKEKKEKKKIYEDTLFQTPTAINKFEKHCCGLDVEF